MPKNNIKVALIGNPANHKLLEIEKGEERKKTKQE